MTFFNFLVFKIKFELSAFFEHFNIAILAANLG